MRNNTVLLTVTVASKSEAKAPTPDAKPVGFKVQSVCREGVGASETLDLTAFSRV